MLYHKCTGLDDTKSIITALELYENSNHPVAYIAPGERTTDELYKSPFSSLVYIEKLSRSVIMYGNIGPIINKFIFKKIGDEYPELTVLAIMPGNKNNGSLYNEYLEILKKHGVLTSGSYTNKLEKYSNDLKKFTEDVIAKDKNSTTNHTLLTLNYKCDKIKIRKEK